MIADILKAMRADCVPNGTSGRWSVVKKFLTPNDSKAMAKMEAAKFKEVRYVPSGSYTWLFCHTVATMMQTQGEVVMNDFPCELRKHLQFVLRARGRVLVTGLGLGCVVRGLLAHGKVESIDLVERSPDVLKLCRNSVDNPRVRIHHHDAVDWTRATDGRWDWAWHDLWSDPERNERGLQGIHGELMANLATKAKKQGAWAMPRWFFRRLPEMRI